MVIVPEIVAEPPGKKATVTDFVGHVLAVPTRRLVMLDAGVRAANDPEDLHEFRVAIRRMRSDLRSYRPLLDEAGAEWFRDELRWLGDAIGGARDNDVMQERFRARARDVPLEEGPAVEALLDHLAGQRSCAQSRILTALSTDRYRALVSAAVGAARAPSGVVRHRELAREAARPLVARLARRQARRLAAALEGLTPGTPDEELHHIRVLTKRSRYAAEAAATVVGRPGRDVASRLAEAQTVLGRYNDTVVAERWLRAAAATLPSTGLAIGQLIAAERAERARHRRKLASLVRRTTLPALRTWAH